MLVTSQIQARPLNQYVNLSGITEQKELEAILQKLGLDLSGSELNQLYCGQFVSLENLALADVGTIFILASAIANHNFKRKNISFRDLLLLSGTTDSFGIPLYCWDNDTSAKYYLRLTFMEGVPMIVIQNQVD